MEANKAPNPIPFEQKTIPPQILEKFSKGSIQLGDRMEIQGDREERKLSVKLTPDDPAYLEFLKDQKTYTDFFRKVDQLAVLPENEAIAVSFEMRKLNKRSLGLEVVSREVNKFLEVKLDDFAKKRKEIPTGESTESLLADEVRELNDLTTYINYLMEQGAFETILPEQQTTQ